MKYLLMELPAFIVGLLLGLFTKDIYLTSPLFLLGYLIFLSALYQGLTYAYVQYISKEKLMEIKPIAIVPEKLEPKINLKKTLIVKKVNPEYAISKFKVLKSLTLNGIQTTEMILECKVNMKENYVEIINENNTKIDLTRFNSLVELNFLELIS